MRYEIRARNNPLNDYVVLVETDLRERALALLAMARHLLPGWAVWCFDTHECMQVDT